MHFLEFLLSCDRSLFLLINVTWSNPILDIIFRRGTDAKFWIIPGSIAAGLFIYQKRKQALVVLGLALIIVALTDPLAARILKPLFGRTRPCHPDFFVVGGHFLSGMKHSLSFPSAHAVNIAAQATLLSWFYPRWRWVYALFALFICYSRVYVGVHYPLDVVGGAVIGVLVALGVLVCYRLVVAQVALWRGKELG